MQRDPIHVTFEEFAGNLGQFFDRVAQGQETVVVEGAAGAQVEVRPAHAKLRRLPRRRTRTPADYEAFLAAAGSWADVDEDEFLRKVYESRDLPPRPRVEL